MPMCRKQEIGIIMMTLVVVENKHIGSNCLQNPRSSMNFYQPNQQKNATKRAAVVVVDSNMNKTVAAVRHCTKNWNTSHGYSGLQQQQRQQERQQPSALRRKSCCALPQSLVRHIIDDPLFSKVRKVRTTKNNYNDDADNDDRLPSSLPPPPFTRYTSNGGSIDSQDRGGNGFDPIFQQRYANLGMDVDVPTTTLLSSTNNHNASNHNRNNHNNNKTKQIRTKKKKNTRVPPIRTVPGLVSVSVSSSSSLSSVFETPHCRTNKSMTSHCHRGRNSKNNNNNNNNNNVATDATPFSFWKTETHRSNRGSHDNYYTTTTTPVCNNTTDDDTSTTNHHNNNNRLIKYWWNTTNDNHYTHPLLFPCTRTRNNYNKNNNNNDNNRTRNNTRSTTASEEDEDDDDDFNYTDDDDDATIEVNNYSILNTTQTRRFIEI